MQPSDEFYDDPGSALKIGHSSTTGAPSSASRRVSGGIEQFFEPQIAAHRKIAAELLTKRARELMAEGCTDAQARRLAQAERDDPKILRQLRDYEGDHRRKLEYLMGVYNHVVGGSSGSGSKFKSRKTGTRVCRECHLEGCTCYVGPGRPFKAGRSEDVGCKVTPLQHDRMIDEKVAAGMIVSSVVEKAAELGRPIGDVLAMLEGLGG